MTFALRVDGERWSKHVDGRLAALAIATGNAAVPVVKGGGYGLGQERLVQQVQRRDLPWLAVGTIYEALDAFRMLKPKSARLLVLEPFDPRDSLAAAAWSQAPSDLITRTVASPQGLQAVCAIGAATTTAPVSFVLEARTSMRRFGFSEDELLRALTDTHTRTALRTGQVLIEGLALHLPLAQPADDVSPRAGGPVLSAKVRQVLRWAGLWQAELEPLQQSHQGAAALWVSHCSDEELLEISSAVPKLTLRQRTGSDLWLGDRRALRAEGTVLNVTDVPGGTPVGYRQRSRSRSGQLLTVSGGTWHGIGLQAPSPVSSARQRAVAAGTGALDATGRALSPFTWDGRQRWFAEPPHQHVSMLWLPHNCTPPKVGDVLAADVRFTTSRFDVVLGLD
ncbi:MAG: alanine racemase [Actinomycetales bacterium]